MDPSSRSVKFFIDYGAPPATLVCTNSATRQSKSFNTAWILLRFSRSLLSLQNPPKQTKENIRETISKQTKQARGKREEHVENT